MERLEVTARHICRGNKVLRATSVATTEYRVPTTPGGGQLNGAELRFFQAFGFLHARQSFSRGEMATIMERVDERINQAGSSGFGPIEGDTTLTTLLLEDERMGGTVAQLMHLYGERRHLLATSSHLRSGPVPSSRWQGFSSLPPDTPPAQDERWFEHGWHSDIPGPTETLYPRIKVMIYLTNTSREHGSLRVLPGSHTFDYQRRLKRLQGHHGIHTYHPQWAAGTFGTTGAELPSTPIEATVGDVLFFHHSLYHAVFNHASDRRVLSCSFVGYPHSPSRLASLWRHPDGALGDRNAVPPRPSPLLAHSNPAIRALAATPDEYKRLQTEAQAAHHELAFEEADISVYPPAIEHRARTGMLQWRAAASGGKDPCEGIDGGYEYRHGEKAVPRRRLT